MKLKYTFLAACLAITALSACVSENQDLEGESSETGSMELNVSQIEPIVTRSETEVSNYPVIVYKTNENGSIGSIVRQWETVSEVPSKVLFSVGNYIVESHTPGTCAPQMSTPYYKGTFDMEIVKGQLTQVNVICKMINSKIQIIYDAEFLELFTSWTITIDDGVSKAFDITNENGTSPAPIYWLFPDKCDVLTLNFRGETTQGKTVTDKKVLKKEFAVSGQYETDDVYFVGGDALEITIKPEAESIETGKVENIVINAKFTFSQTGDTKFIEVTDSDSGNNPGGQGGGGENPGSDNAITLNMPPDMTVTSSTDPSLGDAEIITPKGIKSLSVTIESSSEDMIEALEGIPEDYPNVDFIHGVEVVGNSELVEFLGEVGQTITVPTEGAKSYTFPIGNFFSFLLKLPGIHTFHMTVEDLEGNKKQGTINLTI